MRISTNFNFLGHEVNDLAKSPVTSRFEMFGLCEIQICDFMEDMHLYYIF